jgi:RNA polymerase primary sigma factor
MKIRIKAILYNENLRKARLDAGYSTIALLSKVSGLHPSYLSGLETMRNYPGIKALQKLSALLEKDPEYLFPELSKKISQKLKGIKELSFTREIDERFIVDKEAVKEGVKLALDDLPKKEKFVIEARFGIIDGKERTLEEIGNKLGTTREMVRQTELRALRKLKHASPQNGLKELANV